MRGKKFDHQFISVASWAAYFMLVSCVVLGWPYETLADTQTAEEWTSVGRTELRRAIFATRHPNLNLARNIILFVGDGMGVSTVTAARIHAGQTQGKSGEENRLFFERFPHIGLMKTYNNDEQTPDSAGSATAILSGIKVNYGVIGLDGRVKRGNCSEFNKATKLKTILHRFVDEGLSTGVVTNSRITHATPASAYAHTPHRGWEGDVDLEKGRAWQPACDDVEDIAKQLILRNQNIKVILGGGRRYFLDNSTADPQTGTVGPEHRQDGLNLVDEWLRDKEERNKTHSYVWNKDDFDSIEPEKNEFVLGLFRPSHMDYESWPHNNAVNRSQPNLMEMTRKAIQVLQNDRNGFFLMVEAARIDWGHHANSGSTAIRETIELDEAVRMAYRMTRRRDTLILVTADHSHAFAIQGYSPRGSDILGHARPRSYLKATDGMPYTTLAYTNGPQVGRRDLTNVDTTSPNYKQPGCIPMRVESHAGEDVAAYAHGPMAHLVHSTHEQNYLYHVMEYASCLGWSKQYCHYYRRSS